jgi:beta-lactamase class D
MRILKLLTFLFIIINLAEASDPKDCFIISDLKTQQVLVQLGKCDIRVSPLSTFKIALSLIGFDKGVLKNAEDPKWNYKPEYKKSYYVWLDGFWNQNQTPNIWIRYSTIWYSQLLTKYLGPQEFQRYVKLLNYGNQDISGDPGENNGLTYSWLNSSLKISPKEQIVFIEKLIKEELPVSEHAHKMTKQLLYLEEINDGWKLFGKTGSGIQKDQEGKHIEDRYIGWFVGWVEKDDQTLAFAYLKCDDKDEEIAGGIRAKAEAISKLKLYIPH